MSHQYIKRNFPHEPFPVNCQVFGIALLDIRQCAFSAFTRQGETATFKKPLLRSWREDNILWKTWVWFLSSTSRRLVIICKPNAKGSDALFWSRQEPARTCTHIPTHIPTPLKRNDYPGSVSKQPDLMGEGNTSHLLRPSKELLAPSQGTHWTLPHSQAWASWSWASTAPGPEVERQLVCGHNTADSWEPRNHLWWRFRLKDNSVTCNQSPEVQSPK